MPPLSHIFILDTISSNRTCKADSPMVKTATSHCIPLFGFRARCPSSLTPIGSSVFWLMGGQRRFFKKRKHVFPMFTAIWCTEQNLRAQAYIYWRPSLWSPKSSHLTSLLWTDLSSATVCGHFWHASIYDIQNSHENL